MIDLITGDPVTVLNHCATIADNDIDVFEAALAFASLDRADTAEGEDQTDSRTSYRVFAQTAAADLKSSWLGLFNGMSPQQAADRAMALSACLHTNHGFTGDRDTYDALENADLMAVIDRRKGLPVTLSILYLDLARRLDWPAYGLNFPGHFLIRIDGDGDRVVVDPFNDGAIVTTAGMRALLKSMSGPGAELQPSFYEPLPNRAILIRLQNNIRLRRIKSGDFVGAIRVLERVLMLAPQDIDAWYGLGMLEIHRGHGRAGRQALETCLDHLKHLPHLTAHELDIRQRVVKTLREVP